MMARNEATQIEMIPVDAITVINPRVRNRRQHLEIIESIKTIGLKRPITVSRKPPIDGKVRYDLVCGQGRLEAFQYLGQTEIPAIVIDAAEDECLLKSLVENVARRQHSPMELMQEVGNLRKRGYNDNQISEKIGVSAYWVSVIAGLLENGEQRLVSAVETGLLPISLAVEIAKSDDTDIQELLTDAYTKGTFRGKKLIVVRRLLEQRAKHRKKLHSGPMSRNSPKRLTADQLRKVYEAEAERQRILIKKSEFVQNKIMFVVHVFKELLAKDDGFSDLLNTQDLAAIPRQLHERIA